MPGSNVCQYIVTYKMDSLREFMKEYIALSPKYIGKLGSYWITDDMLGLLDSFFMVRTFRIYQPDCGVLFIQTLQFNVEKHEHRNDNSPFDCIFEIKDNKYFFSFGIQFIFFLAVITTHFCWSMKKNSLVSYRPTVTRCTVYDDAVNKK